MIIYNVTCSMDTSIADEWLQWMIEVHIPEVMKTGCFQNFKILKILTNVEDDHGINYSIQYHSDTLEMYQMYMSKYSKLLQQKTRDKYGDRIMAFRTLLEEVDTSRNEQ